MGNLVMSFRGLNLHVDKERTPLPKGIEHRVIAINANLGHTVPVEDYVVTLEPHVCFLEVSPDVCTALIAAGLPTVGGGIFPLSGANLSVGNSRGGGLSRSLDAVPCLTDYSSGMTLRPEVYEGDDAPAQSACYVDMKHGSLVATTHACGGVFTTWTVETSEGQDPVLRFKWRDQRDPLSVQIPSTPTTTPPAALGDGLPGSIVVHNAALNDGDKTFDFVHYYYAAREGGIPAKFTKPFPQDDGICLEHVGPTEDAPITKNIGLTTSCSNSQYP
jgi:hypothetical protein